MNNKIVFGAGQIGAATPVVVKRVYQTLMFLSLLWELVQPQVAHLPAETLDHIDKALAAGIPILYAFCQCFGIQNPANAAGPGNPGDSGSTDTGGKMW